MVRTLVPSDTILLVVVGFMKMALLCLLCGGSMAIRIPEITGPWDVRFRCNSCRHSASNLWVWHSSDIISCLFLAIPATLRLETVRVGSEKCLLLFVLDLYLINILVKCYCTL